MPNRGDRNGWDVRRGLLVASALIATGAAPSFAQDYPTRPLRIIVPFTPGAGNDTQGRILARKFQEAMGQSVIVDNRPGAAGMLGADMVAKASADGYVLLFTTASISANATLRKTAAFDPLRDLAPISLASIGAQFLIVHPSLPVRSVKELVALAKANPGKLNAGSSGSGASIHLAIELFKQLAGVNITHVPYKGGAQALNALMSGEVDLNFQGALPSLPVIRAGKVRALAVTTKARSAAAPDLPTVASVIPGFESVNWFALFAPVSTPTPIVSRLAAETAKAFKAPDIRELLLREGIEPVGSSAAELDAYFRSDVERTAKLIRTANIKVD